jgi:class 3 adenylate cyclase
LTKHIAAHGGGVVKTIGDAVMAVFPSPEQGVRAALDIQKNIAQWNETDVADEIVIKIGLHHGAAIAVNSNDRLDYFGRSVNIAARIEGASLGGDFVLSGPCYARPEVQRILAENAVEIQHFEARLKGIEDVVTLYRAVVEPLANANVPEERRRNDRRKLEL